MASLDLIKQLYWINRSTSAAQESSWITRSNANMKEGFFYLGKDSDSTSYYFSPYNVCVPFGLATVKNVRGQLETTVAEEKKYNPRLSKDVDTFVDIMENLNLAYPKMIGELLLCDSVTLDTFWQI